MPLFDASAFRMQIVKSAIVFKINKQTSRALSMQCDVPIYLSLFLSLFQSKKKIPVHVTIMSTPRFAIIGAGPGGLTLARILQHNGMQCTIFELDQNRSTRDQGAIVDLHRQMGQLALREAGLFDDFQEHSLPGAEAMKLIKSDGRVFWDEE